MDIIISKNRYTEKPKDAITALQYTANYDYLRNVDVEQFAKLIEEGHAWRACLHKREDTFKEANATKTYTLAMDFDDVETPPAEYIEQARLSGIEPNILYYSYSHQPDSGKYRFRLVWCLQEAISAKDARDKLLALMHFFPDADKSCKNPSRLWFATKLPVEIINEYPTLTSSFGGVEMSYKMDEGMTARDAKKNKKVAVIPV